MKTVADAWFYIPCNEEHAAALLGANKMRVFRTITLPHLLSSILSSFLIVFLFCFFSFLIPLLFGGVGVSTLEVELYRAARYSFDIRFASKIALTEFLFAFFVISIYVVIKSKYPQDKSKLNLERMQQGISKSFEKICFAFTVILILLFLVLPLISIILYSLYTADYGFSSSNFISISAWKNVFTSEVFCRAFISTVCVGAASAGVSAAAALCFTYLKLFYAKSVLLDVLPFLPLAVSSIMLGLGWKLLSPENNILMLILAQSSVYWPFGWVQIQQSVSTIPENVIAAASLLSGNKVEIFFRIVMPLSKKGIASALAFVFAMSAGDASLPLILGINGFKNLPLLLFGYASSYRFAESAVIAVILCVLSGFVFFIQDNKSIAYK